MHLQQLISTTPAARSQTSALGAVAAPAKDSIQGFVPDTGHAWPLDKPSN